MQVCRHCGWENPEIAAFCTNCGTALGRGRATGPRFRALGLSPGEAAKSGAVDAAWPSIANSSPLARTLVDFPAPDADPDDADTAIRPVPRPEAPGAPTPLPQNAPIGRRTTGPVLLPDEAASSVDIGPPTGEHLARTEQMQRVAPSSAPPVADPEEAPDAAAPEPPPVIARPQPTPAPVAAPPAPDEPEGDAPDDDDGQLNTEPHPTVPTPAAVDSLEEDGFDEFIDPAGDDGLDDPDASDEVADPTAPEDSLSEAINDFAQDADDVRIEPPSEGPYADEAQDAPEEELEDELELSTSDLHTVDLDVEPEVDEVDDEPPEPPPVSSTSPALRAVPPPLPAVSIRYVLRPFSRNDARLELVPIGAGPVVIGRADGDVRVDDDDYVSPVHARFAVHESALYVEDLDSLNGVWLRVRVDAPLDDGDEILVGQQLLRIQAAPRRTNGVSPGDGTRRLGIAPDRSPFRVVQLAADGEPLDVYHLPSEGCRVGRRLGDIVFTEDTFMSGTHALLTPRDGHVVLHDLSSRNGCWVRIRGRAALETGDAVMIGRTVWRVGRPVG